MDSMYFLSSNSGLIWTAGGGGCPRGLVYSYMRPPELPTLRPEFKHCVQVGEHIVFQDIPAR